VMGGFTTYSSFNFEVFRLLQEGRTREAAGYVLVTLCGCFLAGAAGYAAARAIA
jgi:fluoride exporter